DPEQRGAGGISRDYYWAVCWEGTFAAAERDQVLDPQSPGNGGSADNSVRGLIRLYEDDTERVRFFGFPALRGHSFLVTEDNAFSALTLEGVLIQGQFLTASNGRPESLQYSVGNQAKNSFHFVTYRYKEKNETMLPDYFEATSTLNG